MEIVVIQHVAFETPGLIVEWARENGHELRIIQVFAGDSLPAATSVSALIVLGGPMSALDPDKWLAEERALIKAVVLANKPFFGICLGAQQLALAFGAEIVKTKKEVGWGTVSSLDSETYTVLHWHGEGFTLPRTAKRIFSSTAWQNQGFQFNQAVGLQFHLESTPETIKQLTLQDAAFCAGSVFKQKPSEIRQQLVPPENKKLLFEWLTKVMK
jgi:GMP synthase (glutamine-hydrolysing)